MGSTTISSPAIVLTGIAVRFSAPGGAVQTVLEQLQLHCAAGQLLGVVGPSGCGKSTLLRLIAGLQGAWSGQIHFQWPAASKVLERPRVGFVFQSPNLLPWRDVDGNIGLPLDLAGVSSRNRSEQVSRVRELVGLGTADIHKLPRQLSGGMQMRVSLARALVTQPHVMLLDEPFAALDDIMRQQLNDELRQLQARHRWTTLFVTHNVAEAVYLADQVLVLGRTPPSQASPVQLVTIPWCHARPDDLRREPIYQATCEQVAGRLRMLGDALGSP